jgi:transposase
VSQSPVYVGIDVSKEMLDLSAPGLSRSYPNTPKGFSQILKTIPPDAHVVMEATGGYERKFVAALHQAKRKLSVLNPRHVRDFAKAMGQRAKSDKIDAEIIARFAASKHPSPDPEPLASRLRLNELVARRTQLLEVRSAEANRREHHSMEIIRKRSAMLIEILSQQIEELTQLIAEEIEADEDFKAKAERLRQVKGVGPVVAAAALAHMPELGSISRSAAASLLGVAPFVCDSGGMKGSRRTFGGRAQLRAVIYMGALNAARANPILKAFYQKLRAAGKPFKVAITAVMRKLIVLLNHLLANPDFSLAR